MEWQSVLPGVELCRDSCNVYAVSHPGGTVFVNAATGNWLETLPTRFQKPFTLLCTHYFRDHGAGAARASKMGMRIFVPAGEIDIFSDPQQHFRERKAFITYDNIWDAFAPIEPTAANPAHDYSTLNLDGLQVMVVPLPGVTPNHTGYAITLPLTGQRVAFAGEAIHSSGRMARIAPLQYDYNDLGGAVNAYWSAGELRRAKYDAVLPSLGAPILTDPDGALAALENSLASFALADRTNEGCWR